ncbi:MAG: hypothetical protein U1F34_08805 [Gammaproteobacteria bacterium]
MRWLAALAMRGRFFAATTAALLVAIGWKLALLMPLLSCLSGAVVALVTLRHGSSEGLLVTGMAAAMMAVFATLTFQSPWPAMWVAAGVWLPALICALVLRRWRSQGMLLATASTLAAMFAGALRWYTGDVKAWWRGILDNMVSVASEHGSAPDVTPAALDLASSLLNSLVAASMMVTLMLTVLLARLWQAQLYNPGGFAPEFRALRLPQLASLIAIGIVLAAIVLKRWQAGADGSFGYAADLFAIGVCALGFHGLAWVHRERLQRRLPVGLLVVVYIALLALPFYAVMLLAAIAFADLILSFAFRRQSGG